MDKQRLEKAIKKATSNGYKIDGEWEVIEDDGRLALLVDNSKIWAWESIVFSHQFAKALWGETEFSGLDLIAKSKDVLTGVERKHYWQYHLQQMVIAGDPIKYLGDNI